MLEAKREGAVWRSGNRVFHRGNSQHKGHGAVGGPEGEMEWGLRGSEDSGLHAE